MKTNYLFIMYSNFAAGRALLGQERWDDYEVVQMQGVLFGNDDTAADSLICDIRAKLINGLKISFRQLIKKEKLVYGQKSFFAYTELSKKSLPSYPPPPADRDSDVESLAELTCSGNSDAGLSCEESDEDM